MLRRDARKDIGIFDNLLQLLVAGLVELRTADLQQALASVKRLSGLLPICSSCKKIRDDKGYWNQIEAYVRDHSEAEFSHSYCPECIRVLYPGIGDRAEE